MRGDIFIGVYWFDRVLTLRQYANLVRQFFDLLRAAHPVFYEMQWSGTNPRNAVNLLPNLENLDELIYRHACSKRDGRGDRNLNGSVNWASESRIGFGMTFDSGKSPRAGGVLVSSSAGREDNYHTPNNCVVAFPDPSDRGFPHRELYDYDFVVELFGKLISLTAPRRGLVTTHAFGDAIHPEKFPEVGWLTYVSDDRSKLPVDRHATEQLTGPGTLFSLGRERFLDTSPSSIAAGQALYKDLVEDGVIDRFKLPMSG